MKSPPIDESVLRNECGGTEIRLVKIDAGWSMYATGVMVEGFASLERAMSAAVPAVVSISYGEPESSLGTTGNSYINSLYSLAAAGGVEVGAGQVRRERLTECQRAGEEGRLAGAMAAFVKWVAGQYEELQQSLRHRVLQIRGQGGGGWGHARTPAAWAELQGGWEIFLQFAMEVGALTVRSWGVTEDLCRDLYAPQYERGMGRHGVGDQDPGRTATQPPHE